MAITIFCETFGADLGWFTQPDNKLFLCFGGLVQVNEAAKRQDVR
jgi:hypothetical protein